MHKQMFKSFTLAAIALALTACNGFFEKDNTPEPKPLVPFKAEITPRKLWSTSAGSGTKDEYLKLNPAMTANAIFVANANGHVTAINKQDGRRLWEVNTREPVTTGPGVGNGIVAVGSRNGYVMALDQATGNTLWKATVPGELLANPAVGDGLVIVKAIDGYVRALAINDGHQVWAFQQVEPSLVLRGSSSPLIRDRNIIVGFANGNLAKLTVNSGEILWTQTIAVAEGAFAIQRMIDIDADPIAFEHRIFAATYQGKISSLDWSNGNVLWSHDISSYTGMTADSKNVYITDATGHVWSFNGYSGLVNWRQLQLESRVLSAPASMGNYVVVGDGKGYLHWLDKRDGHFAGQTYAGSAVYAAPIVDNNVLYALTNNGNLVAYTY